jgi:hypothetical protein
LRSGEAARCKNGKDNRKEGDNAISHDDSSGSRENGSRG